VKPSPNSSQQRGETIQRFSRQLILDGVGKAGQEAWLRCGVEVLGEGRAAWMTRRYLAAAGVRVGVGSDFRLRLQLQEDSEAAPIEEAIRGVEVARKTLLALLPGAEPMDDAPARSSSPEARGPTPLADPLVVVVGAGGLGCPALLGLVWAGVQRLRIIDDDVVELSNLPRQILHNDPDLRKPKAISASEELQSLHPALDLKLDPRVERLAPGNIERLLDGADLVIEASDNFPTKFRVNAATRLMGIPAIIGGVIRFEGQTFALPATSGVTPCYRCFFPQAPSPGTLPTCSSAGVLGPVAGAVALAQVQQGLALLGGSPPSGPLNLYDGKAGTWTSMSGRPGPSCVACGDTPDDPALRGAAEGRGRPGC